MLSVESFDRPQVSSQPLDSTTVEKMKKEETLINGSKYNNLTLGRLIFCF